MASPPLGLSPGHVCTHPIASDQVVFAICEPPFHGIQKMFISKYAAEPVPVWSTGLRFVSIVPPLLALSPA